MRRLDDDVRGLVVHAAGLAAHDTGEADDARRPAGRAVRDEQVLRVEGAVDAVERLQVLPRTRATHDDRADEAGGVVRVQRLPEVEHDVVRHVDREVDGPHARLLQPPLHPRRGRLGGAYPAHRHRDEPVAAGHAVERLVVDLDGEPAGGRRQVGRRGGAEVREVGAGRVRVLAGDAAHGEAVAAVGRDVDLEHLLADAEQRLGVEARRGRLVGQSEPGQHDDPVVVLTDAELACGADHPVGDVPVRLARGDREAAGQHRSRQRDDDVVAGLEVVRAADDAARRLLADVDLAPVDRLAVGLRLGAPGQDVADDEGAGDLAGAVDRLLLEPDAHQLGGELLGGQAGRQRDVGAQPGERDEHHLRSPP